MKLSEPAFHYVCTHERAGEIIRGHDRFWISNCGCRENRGKCNRSRNDVCLIFAADFPGSGSNKRKATLEEANGILREAGEKHLVARPFRNEAKTGTEGICFCCDDCCAYFLNPAEKCDRGELVENTRQSECNNCGECVDVCYFKARKLEGDRLVVAHDNCYGCGLCAEICPEECIQLVSRT